MRPSAASVRCVLVLGGLLLAAAPSLRADYRTLEVSTHQDEILEGVLARVHSGSVVMFDLDSVLFDNRPRQVAILRTWAARQGITDLGALAVEHFQEYGLDDAFRRAGVSAHRLRELRDPAKRAWRAEFWGETALVHDLTLPGAAAFVRQVHALGGVVAYVGRRTTQEQGTRCNLERFGFPLDERAQLICEVVPEGGRDISGEARRRVHEQVEALGTVVAAFDNEGPAVDGLRQRWPEAVVVHVKTDGPSFTRQAGPWVRGFLRRSDVVPEPLKVKLAHDVPAPGKPLRMVNASDGDTITVEEVQGGRRFVLRLIGIDTPEKDDLYGQPSMAGKEARHRVAYGDRLVDTKGSWVEAKEFVLKRVAGRRIFLRYDPSNASSGHRDSTGSRRVLAYVFVMVPDGEPIDLNAELCSEGYTYDYSHRYPHIRMKEFSTLIQVAQAEGRGYWSPRYQEKPAPEQAPPEQAPPEQAPPEQAPPEQAPPEQVDPSEQAGPEQGAPSQKPAVH